MDKHYHHGDLKNALIQAGFEILAEEGMAGLTLRKAAKRAGVSHAAPYAHFADKQALIAEIAARGYQDLYRLILKTAEKYRDDPIGRVIETAWTYVNYAVENPAQFKITFSGIVDKEESYPAYLKMSMRAFALVVDGVIAWQRAGILKPGNPQMLAISVWAGVHGFALLLLENQIPRALLARYSVRELLMAHLRQVVSVELPDQP
jgi:AcrR family transcriptional regulator